MAPSVNIREKAIALIQDLPQERLVDVVQFLENLSASPELAGEAKLIRVITQNPLTEVQQERLVELRDRGEQSPLNEPEHQERLSLEDQMEAWTVQRLEAMIKLAELRNTDLQTINQQFQPQTATNA